MTLMEAYARCRRSRAGTTLTSLPQVSVLIIPQAVKDRRKSGLSNNKPPHDDEAEDEVVGQHIVCVKKNIIKLQNYKLVHTLHTKNRNNTHKDLIL